MSDDYIADFLLGALVTDDEGDTGAEKRERGRMVDVRILSQDDEKAAHGDDEQQDGFEKWEVLDILPLNSTYAWLLVRR